MQMFIDGVTIMAIEWGLNYPPLVIASEVNFIKFEISKIGI